MAGVMDIRPIRSKRDYRRALARIEELMDAKSGTVEGDELYVLATLVEAYEDRHFPIQANRVIDGRPPKARSE